MKNNYDKMTNNTINKYDQEIPPREGFIFYRTFYEALSSMKPRAQLRLYNAIMKYSFEGVIPTDLNDEMERVFILIRPQLDANERKRQKKYKEKMSRENFFEESNEFSEKTEIHDDSIIQITNDIEYK